MLLLTLALSALFAPSAHAFRLEPMVLTVPVTEPRAAGTYTVENNTTGKVAVEFQMKERRIDAEGNEERPAAAGFLVYPQQLSLAPGEKRSVRVTWAGDKVPAGELAYRLVATQLPVDFAKEKSGTNIKFLLEYVASFYLTPKNAKGKLKVAKQLVNEKGELEVRVKNEGNAHELLEKLELTVQGGGKTFTPPKEILAELRTGNVLAGAERVLRVALPKGFAKDARAKVSFAP
jgi:fimbrial chaperone protein